jgi:hypothetical protein
MFIGHYAVALGAKKAAPSVSLGTLILSTQWLDLLWPVFLLLNIEHVRIHPGDTAFTPLDFYDYPITHGLLAALAWSIGFALVYYVFKRSRRGAWVLAVGVFSHWILDFITHRRDLPVIPGGTVYIGLGLWNSVTWTVIVEGVLFVVGVILYARFTKARDRTGRYAFWSLIAFLSLTWIANMLGPPPPNETALAFVALLLWLLVPWGYWIDRHRQTVGTSAAE